MSDEQRPLARALGEGARERLKAGRDSSVSWARRLAPAPVLLRLTVALALFLSAELAAPPEWSSAALYVAIAAFAALAAALFPAGAAPLVAIAVTVGAWLLGGVLDEDRDPTLWTAAGIACLLYTAHSAAALAQRLRMTTAVDGEIILTWGKHLVAVLASTVGVAAALALFTAYFTGLTAGLAVGAGIVASVTVIYVLARSLHKRTGAGQN